MRCTFAILALSAVASAGLLGRQNIPSCVTSCLSKANLGTCAQNDESCLCHNQAFVSSIATCLRSTCDSSDLQQAESLAQAVCLCEGVTLSAYANVPAATESQASPA
ncbi:hypothetical protein HYDPIDRAFT_33195 [Hydnomerulius pinastri MD-312]|uniref:CFEM domain-containing protein n=1 Tax=Hydnomerulius pinastri MD-312 TaxID=994086 RepID=A0A0C9VP15_9AGAM|nr:hypothetical protein HYDPIDRAFT_33195 [Hydnomerulius pinastri MD-312]